MVYFNNKLLFVTTPKGMLRRLHTIKTFHYVMLAFLPLVVLHQTCMRAAHHIFMGPPQLFLVSFFFSFFFFFFLVNFHRVSFYVLSD